KGNALTHTQVAKALDVNPQFIKEIENGEAPPSTIAAQQLSRLCELYNVEENWLINNTIELSDGNAPSLPSGGHRLILCEQGPLPTNTISAATLLENAANHIQNRASQRDSEDGGRSMANTVASFNAMYGTNISEQQGWMFMVFLKASRAKQGQFVKDDFEDGASYFALAGEAASKEAA
ncbi:DUF6378 domain-containing protein, partial [Marinagarivorans algicola]|uniref:DUF6378 domain-containing protein n=1 Tax=Marinagarivorans algicola TaxID=1513270 RepID=UPI0012E276BB